MKESMIYILDVIEWVSQWVSHPGCPHCMFSVRYTLLAKKKYLQLG